MRCRACNVELSDYESTRKYSATQEYVDLCDHCWYNSDMVYEITVEERDDLCRQLPDLEEEVSQMRLIG